jgi:hypothetical protein
MGTMNLHHFDKAIGEIFEFNQSLDTSIEQLYLNRTKLDVTMNKLLEFCLHIDTEQYGYDFPAAKEVEKIRKGNLSNEFMQEELKDDIQHQLKVNPPSDIVSFVLNSGRSKERKSQISIKTGSHKQSII